MKSIITYLSATATLLLITVLASAQPTIYPAKVQDQPIAIIGATIHVGDGKVITQGTLLFEQGKITYVGGATTISAGTLTIDAAGKHVYPGFIATNTNLGLVEVESVRATIDYAEVGENNAHVRSLIAYNTDSKVINTLRSNGILLAQITPQDGLVSGQSSIVQLDAWNWEDAAYKIDEGIHINWPTVRFGRFGGGGPSNPDAQKEQVQAEIAQLEDYLSEAKAYASSAGEYPSNARFEAFKAVFSGERKVYVHANRAADIIAAISSLKRLGIKPVLVGGAEAHLVTELLKDNQVPVIIRQSHSLPYASDADVYLPYKQAKLLADAGILIAYSIDGFWQQRNLPFMAGTAAAYGLDKEQALATITSNTAKILGIDNRTGTLEVGKDANVIVSSGDALDMLGNDIERAFIQGRDINLDDLHKQLFERYEYKYGLIEDK
ncbi:amidohydrolase family protein [Parapedobacter koreensis]|uniref:Imidazolonepropionase n=1 Tax=Parapedobacter koreensis TaxID=332977 RepID=A0A1H7P3D9_9SPHI|nr:amidohydrolase family protein [Parapedobacter koreensis]SEL30400.1 Imidazolonepropionase [Parapedobacter koreensis]